MIDFSHVKEIEYDGIHTVKKIQDTLGNTLWEAGPAPEPRTVDLMTLSSTGDTVTNSNYRCVKIDGAVAEMPPTTRNIDWADMTKTLAEGVTFSQTQLHMQIYDTSFHARAIGGTLTPPIGFLATYAGDVYIGVNIGTSMKLNGTTVNKENVKLQWNAGTLLVKTIDTDTLLVTYTFSKLKFIET